MKKSSIKLEIQLESKGLISIIAGMPHGVIIKAIKKAKHSKNMENKQNKWRPIIVQKWNLYTDTYRNLNLKYNLIIFYLHIIKRINFY